MNGESKATLFALPLILGSLLVAIASGSNRMRTSDRRMDSHKGQESNLQPFSIPASSSPAANDPPADFRDGALRGGKGCWEAAA